jgi:hypothetical protein
MLLERGLLSFDKETKMAILIPWSVITGPVQYGAQAQNSQPFCPGTDP